MEKTNRALLKAAARESMGLAQPSAKMVTLVYVLLTTVLTSIIENVMANPFEQLGQLVMSGYDPEWAMYAVFSSVSLPLIAFVSILLALYSGIMSYGYTAYCLRLSRREQAGYGTLLEGFSMVGKVLVTHILVGVFTFLWGLLLAIPFSIVAGILMAFFGNSSLGIIGVTVVLVILYIALLVGLCYFALRYVLADHALFDAPEAGSLAAISRSKELMNGRKLEYVVMALSFLGWAILVAVLSGIGGGIGGLIGSLTSSVTAQSVIRMVLAFVVSLPLSLWLTPYMGCTYANFYNEISGYHEPEAPNENPGEFPYL